MFRDMPLVVHLISAWVAGRTCRSCCQVAGRRYTQRPACTVRIKHRNAGGGSSAKASLSPVGVVVGPREGIEHPVFAIVGGIDDHALPAASGGYGIPLS